MTRPIKPFEELDQYITSLQTTTNVDDIVRILQSQIEQLGFSKMTYWLRWHRHNTKRPVLLSTYPEAFLDHYAENDFQSHDMVGRFSNEKNTPFTWSDIAKELPITRKQKILFADSSAVGLRSGGSIPFHGPRAVKATFSVANDVQTKEFDDLFNRHRHLLHLIGAYAHERIMQLGLDTPKPPLELSSREIEILLWAARGKTYWEISMILSIQEDTVKKHAQNIFTRLGASNMPHAVCKALIHGLINP
ncbi:MAG: LuxR family transcriptional regulator [Nitrospira sp.]|nr:LuxR family transcriptional regulator [Nitrospira sp.]MCA9498856.1 LuxR family transcriptional regulator [Nitrospira sp.]